MSAQATDTSVRASVEGGAPIERAFEIFTEGIGSWWDPTHHILEGELAEMVFEPRVGGHVYDRGVDGSECRWARVLGYERGRGALHCAGARSHSRGARAPEHRAPRRGLGGHA